MFVYLQTPQGPAIAPLSSILQAQAPPHSVAIAASQPAAGEPKEPNERVSPQQQLGQATERMVVVQVCTLHIMHVHVRSMHYIHVFVPCI